LTKENHYETMITYYNDKMYYGEKMPPCEENI
jgi:hypothetical protein